jgi:hypothetical protein
MMSIIHDGVLLPATFVESRFFIILATLVALNTTIYTALAVAKLLPKLLRPAFYRRSRRRQETRSIFPDAPV